MASTKPSKRRASSTVGARRRPSWSVISFAEIERWRTSHDLPKRRMAELLGVTNSTYHNWARGKAVPTVNAQRKLRATLDGPQAGASQDEQAGGASAVQAETLRATAAIVNTYLETHPGKLSPEQMTHLIREVRAAVSE
ncbi:MAG: helix-turn-helix transcriptional regulator [Planctomycetota bacterium]